MSLGRNAWIGVGMIVGVIVLFGLLFTKNIPFKGPYQVEAVFEDAATVSAKAPVRIAGIDVGQVKAVKKVVEQGEAKQKAVVLLEIQDKGLPIRKDAVAKLRPRLFLYGNYFVELQPGSPGEPEIESGGMIPINQTETAVIVDEVIDMLESDVRNEFRTAIKELGTALVDEGGAEGFNESLAPSKRAFRGTAIVNEALLGTERRDLSRLIDNTQTVMEALGQNKSQLQDLISNLGETAGALAAEDAALRTAISELPPTLQAGRPALARLNEAFPDLRQFADDILPGVRNTPETANALLPFLRQGRRLLARDELGGLTRDLRRAIPDLASFNRASLPLLDETREFANCFNETILPWSNLEVPSKAFPATGEVYKEAGYSLVGIAGESRSGDGNGQYIRVGGGGGPFTVQVGPNAFANTLFPIVGTDPPKNSSLKTDFRPNQPCENQEVPDLRSGGPGAPPPQADQDGNPLPGIPGIPLDAAGNLIPDAAPLPATPLAGIASAVNGDDEDAEDEGEGEDDKLIAGKGRPVPGLTREQRRTVLQELGREVALVKRDELNMKFLRNRGAKDKAERLEKAWRKRAEAYNAEGRLLLLEVLGKRKPDKIYERFPALAKKK